MTLSSNSIIEITKNHIKDSFFNYFLCREKVLTKHLILSRFFPEECVTRSAIGGIETSLGTFWEKLAKSLAIENGFTILNPKEELRKPKNLPKSIEDMFHTFKENREKKDSNLPMTSYTKALKNALNNLKKSEIPEDYENLIKGTGADLFIRKGAKEYAFDLKTVQLNAGGGTKFNETLMKWITYRALLQKKHGTNFSFNAFIAIPYDPHEKQDWWKKFGGRAYPLTEADLLLGDKFWSMVSGVPDCLKYIIKAIDELKSENFQDIYRDSLHKNGIIENIQIIEFNCRVICLTDLKNADLDFTKKLNWKCSKCHKKFSASIKRFKKRRQCPNCPIQD